MNSDNILPFTLDSSYKGDESSKRACEILSLSSTRGWSIVDQVGDLALIHFNEQGNMDEVGFLRGVLIDLESGATVADSFGYTPNVINGVLEESDGKISVTDEDGKLHEFPIETVSIKPAFEGVVIRVVWHNSTMYRITHKKIIPAKSRWGSSKTFISMYEEASGPTAEQLFDTSKPYSSSCYYFLVVDNSLVVATRQVVRVPYIVHLDTRVVDCKRNEDLVTPGVASFSACTSCPPVVSESFMHRPLEMDLVRARDHLSNGYFPSSREDERLNNGEAVMISNVVDGKVLDIVKVCSKSYWWRSVLRGNNPNINNQFYSLLNTVFRDIDDEREWKIFCDKYVLFPLVDESDLKSWFDNGCPTDVMPSKRDLYSRDSRIHMLFVNYIYSLPETSRESSIKILGDYFENKTNVISWLQRIESTCRNVEKTDHIPRVKGIIFSARRLSKEKLARGENKNSKGEFMSLSTLIKVTIKNLINKENGRSLYGLVREMKAPPK